jgi:hypothetical protein
VLVVPTTALCVEQPVVTPVAPAPVILVRSFSTAPGEVMLGQRFSLTLTLRNETKATAKDVVVSLGSTSAGTTADSSNGQSAGGADLVSLDSSDVRYVGDLKGHTSLAVTFNLISSPRASAGVFSLPVNSSSDVSGSRVQSSQNIGLVIGRTASFVEENAELPASAVVGEAFPVSLDVVNTSSYAIPAVTLRLEGEGFDFVDGSILIGTIESGDAGTIEAQATPTASGTATLTVVASYRDDFGVVRDVRFPHRVKVEAQPEGGEPKDVPEDKEPEGPLAGFVSFLMGLLGLGG